ISDARTSDIRGAAGMCPMVIRRIGEAAPGWLAGLVVSGLVYWAFSRSLDLTREQTAIEASDRELEERAGSERRTPDHHRRRHHRAGRRLAGTSLGRRGDICPAAAHRRGEPRRRGHPWGALRYRGELPAGRPVR